jgi:hypothetical protein
MYDEKWAKGIYGSFAKLYPRVHSANLFLVEAAKAQGILIVEQQLIDYAIRSIRVPKYGQEYWKLYKKIVKGRYPSLEHTHWWVNFWSVLRSSARRCGEVLSQKELIYD